MGGWPGEASQGQFRLLWLELFELITAGQGDDIQSSEMAGTVHEQAWRLAPWLEGRIEALANRLTPPQIAVAMAGLHDSMAYVSAIATSMLLQSMEETDRSEGHSEQPEPAAEYEEVTIEEPDTAEAEDAAALMQTGRTGQGRPTPKEESWRPLTRSEKKRIARVVRALLQFQDEAEPSLTVLAFVDETPAMCDSSRGPEEDRDLQVSFGELRPALTRWLWATPRQHVPAAIEVIFEVPGRTHQDQAAVQAAARQLQSEVAARSNPVLDQLLRSWSDSSDAGIVEEALKIAMEGQGKAAINRALTKLRQARRPSDREGRDAKRRMTLLDAWDSMPLPGPSNGTDWVQQHEDSSTLGARTQLLKLQEAWPTLGKADGRTILDTILDNLPRDRVRQQAARIAEIYNHMAEHDTPQTIVTLRVALRQRQPDRGGQAANQWNEVQPSSSEDETDKESKGAAAYNSMERRLKRSRRQRGEEMPKPSRAPEAVDHEAITQPYRLPRKKQ